MPASSVILLSAAIAKPTFPLPVIEVTVTKYSEPEPLIDETTPGRPVTSKSLVAGVLTLLLKSTSKETLFVSTKLGPVNTGFLPSKLTHWMAVTTGAMS